MKKTVGNDPNGRLHGLFSRLSSIYIVVSDGFLHTSFAEQ
jgi:hypothetical protein